ncbi:MAG: two-component sensor histidine kinase [Desulfobacteraceae bacterium]|nr:two-component sensor histidine kinase [Desulfobacteraceae bacterium]
MKPRPVTEKSKPFILVKYFAFTSIVVMFLGTIVLSVLNTHWARRMQYQKSEEYALLLIENLNHQVLMQFMIPVQLKYGKIELSKSYQSELMDTVVRNTMHSFNVEMVNIYVFKEDLIAYSFSQELVGMKNLGGGSYQKARNGLSTSKLVSTGSFIEILLGIPKEVRIITFAPLRVNLPEVLPLPKVSGYVLGVVEIVQDLTADYRTIFRFQVLVIVTITMVMAILFVVLITVVKRGENIIQKRAQERLKLEEQLAKAKHLSTLGTMVAAVSHEIRNPLGIISSSAELLKKKMGSGNSNASIPNIIIEESGRLNVIITDFLNFARPKEPNFVPCDISEILRKNTSYLSSQTSRQGYRIHEKYEVPLPIVMADPDLLYQAFLNLLINAMQAMPDGGDIIISAGMVNGALKIGIDDNGNGVTEELLEKIWNPFFTTKEKGTGLGLGIVKNIIEAHSGSIDIQNRPGKGARVTIHLPESQGA